MKTYFKLVGVGSVLFVGLVTWPWLILNTPLPQAVKQALMTPWTYVALVVILAIVLTWRWYQTNAEWVNHMVRGAMWIVGTAALVAALVYWWGWSKNQLPPATPSREKLIISALGIESTAAHRDLSAAIEDKILEYPERNKCVDGLVLPPIRDALVASGEVAFEGYLGQAVLANDLCRETGRSYADAQTEGNRNRLMYTGGDWLFLWLASSLTVMMPVLAQNTILRRRRLLKIAGIIPWIGTIAVGGLLIFVVWPARQSLQLAGFPLILGIVSQLVIEVAPFIGQIIMTLIRIATNNDEVSVDVRILISATISAFIGQSLALWLVIVATHNWVLASPQLTMGTGLHLLFVGILAYAAITPVIRQKVLGAIKWVGGD